MNIQVNMDSLRNSSQELHEISSAMGKISQELEAVSQALKPQAELFQGQLSALNRAEAAVTDSRYDCQVLSQALENLARIYSQTEELVEEVFEPCASVSSWQKVRSFDFVSVSKRISSLLYGGESK